MTKIKTTVSIRMSDETPQREESYPNDYNKATNMPEEKFNKVIIDWYTIITSFITVYYKFGIIPTENKSNYNYFFKI